MRSIGEHKRLGQRLVAVLIQAALAVLTAALPNTTAAEPGESDCLALAMYWEARGGGSEAMVAVGWVVLNRMKNPEFPDRACAVVRQGGEEPPCQFSYWCDGKVDTPQNDELWSIARDLAVQMLKKPPPDPTGGRAVLSFGRHRDTLEGASTTHGPNRRSYLLSLIDSSHIP
jgi:spore germination cell wall hydrolase CwlJ-like protein